MLLNDPALLGNLLRGVVALAIMLLASALAGRVCRDGTSWGVAATGFFLLFVWLLIGVGPSPHSAGLAYALQWGSFGAGVYSAIQAYRAEPAAPVRAAQDPEALLSFWFGDDLDSRDAVKERSALWFEATPEFDRALRERFGDWPERARRGELDAWQESARSALALVIVLDQLPRNLHRGSQEAFAYDERAREVALRAIERGLDELVHAVECAFFYLPLEHAEDRALQQRSVALFAELAEDAPGDHRPLLAAYRDYAERHRALIERFGRFPHRNQALGRTSTPEELRFLAEGGETFAGRSDTASAARAAEQEPA